MTTKADCIFCKIVNKQIPAQIVFENDDVMAFKDLNPSAPIHYLFVPKKHIDSLAHVTEKEIETISKIFSALLQVTEKEKLNEKGFRTVINTGRQGGQTVFHLHAHLLANKNMKSDFA